MMKKSIANQLTLFGAVVILGILTIVGTQYYTLGQLRINGPLYTDLTHERELLSDTSPSDLSTNTAYMLANQMYAHATLRELNVEKILQVKSKYLEKKEAWKNISIDQALRAELYDELIVLSDAFWDVLENNFIPAVNTNDNIEIEIALGSLLTAFQAHEAATERFIVKADQALMKAEKDAAKQEAFLMLITSMIIILAVLFVCYKIYAFRRKAISPLHKIKDYMAELASGDYGSDVPFLERSDEIGEIAKSVAHFRQAQIERDQIRQQTEDERAQKEQAKEATRQKDLRAASEREHVIRNLKQGLLSLSNGDLSYRIEEVFTAEFEELRSTFNQSVQTLAGTLIDVSTATSSVRSSAETVSQSSDDLSHRTEQQAASLEQTAAALEEITSTVKAATEQAGKASTMVADTKEGAEKSGTVVRSAIEAMTKIEDSSSQISQIIGVIDEIAFQTNLLALNAGVEAARAGDAGKGFAVVAQEVRDLAQRSATAAREIKSLIETSSDHVETGVSLVNETGESLVEIEEKVSAVNEIIHSLVSASHQQSSALIQINSAVTQMDQVTQQNAKMVQETSQSSIGLMELSSRLEDLIKRFHLSGHAQPSFAAHNSQTGPSRQQMVLPPVSHQTTQIEAPREDLQLQAVDNVYVPSRSTGSSPARSLGRKLAGAFANQDASTTPTAPDDEAEWSEF